MKKVFLMVILTLGSLSANAGFECTQKNGHLKVTVVPSTKEGENYSQSNQPDPLAFNANPVDSVITIHGDELEKLQVIGQLQVFPTRVGSFYNYKIADSEVAFSITERTHFSSPVDCQTSRRITCDIEWISTFTGNLQLKGESYDLDCKKF